VAVHDLTFEQMLGGLSRKKGQDALIDRVVNEHSDETDRIVAELVNADRHKTAALIKIFKRLPDQTLPQIKGMVMGSDVTAANAAVSVLCKMEEHGVDVGLDIIQHADPTIADRGAMILRNIGFDAVPFLREKLKRENPPKRGLAILMELDPEAMSFFENALEEMLGTRDQILARYSIDAAASIGDYALPVLVDLIGSSDPFEQQNATNALIKIGEPVVVELIEELDNPNSITQQNAMRALKEIGMPAVPALKEALTSDSQLIKQNATAVLSSSQFKSDKGFFSRFKR